MSQSQRQGRLSYCVECKEMTETVIMESVPFLGIIKTHRRVCKKCGQPKAKSMIEQ